MGIVLARAINGFAQIILMFLVLRALFSWFGQNPYSTSGKIYRFFVNLTEPVVMPCRNLLARLNFNTGMIDFSVFLAMLLVELIANILVRLILMIF